MADGPTRRRSGALEREVLAALAAAEAPMTVADVVAEVGDGLAYTTAMTTLSRLFAKGVVVRERRGRGYAYALSINPETLEPDLIANRMRRMLERENDRRQVLARFVAELEPQDGQMLADLLAERPDGTGADPGSGAG